MHQTDKLMVGVTAVLLLTSTVPSISEGPQPVRAEGKTEPAPDRTVAPEVEEAADEILLLLDRTNSETAKSLNELLQKLPRTSRQVAEQAIGELMLKDQIHRVGEGTNQDPYRYWFQKGHMG
jgi:predicted HTH transcriptional regulator